MVHPLYFAIPVISLGIAAVYYLWKTPSPNNASSRQGPGFNQSSNRMKNQRSPSNVRKRHKAEGKNECQICQDARADVELQPCRHHDICEHCVLSIITKLDRLCPFCRQYITGYVDI